MPKREWRSRAKRRELWRERVRSFFVDPAQALRRGPFLEFGKYLLIANGATLIASIGGIGEAWHHEELRPVFSILVTYFSVGLLASIMAWLSWVLGASDFGHIRWRPAATRFAGVWVMYLVGAAFALIDFDIIIRAAKSIREQFGAPPPLEFLWDIVSH